MATVTDFAAPARPADVRARELAGQIEAILWSDPAAGSVIAKLQPGDGGWVILGRLPEDEELLPRVPYRFLGKWIAHETRGYQFHFDTYTRHAPPTKSGVIKYLIDLAPHCGRVTALRLWEAYGPDAVAVLRGDPARVVADGILTADQAEESAKALAKVAAHEQTRLAIFGLLGGRGFPLEKLIAAALKKWGAKAAERIRANPFGMLVHRLPGAGFKRCDRLYLEWQKPPAALKRAMLAGWFAMRSDSSGNTWHRAEFVGDAIQRSISTCADPVKPIKLGVRSRWLAARRDDLGQVWLAERRKAGNEQTVADCLAQLMTEPARWPTPTNEKLRPHQRENAEAAMLGPIGILAGTPGTGKTFTAAAIIQAVTEAYGRRIVAVCAPTGKAAVRCTQALRGYGLQLEATTIHRLLGVQKAGYDGDGWQFAYNASRHLEQRFVIVDEASMLDTDLAAALLSACAPGTHVLFVGDPYQLPPVGHGAPLRDMIAAGIPCGELKEIMRNAGLIVHACSAIKDGRSFESAAAIDLPTGANLKLIPADTPADTLQAIDSCLELLHTKYERDPVWECQILVAVNQKSELARKRLNGLLQGALNPAGRTVRGNRFRVGDKIICLKNNFARVAKFSEYPGRNRDPEAAEDYEIVRTPDGEKTVFLANGELARVVAVGAKGTVARFLTCDELVWIPSAKPSARGDQAEEDDQAGADENGDGTSGENKNGGATDYDLAYAITVHKCQGSESPVVIVIADQYPGAMRVASREWWYTAVSRAKELCLIVGKREVMEWQARRATLEKRKTFLRELILAEQDKPRL